MTRYEMLDRIGVGGMAEIFRGRAVAGGGFEKPVAIKRILPHLSQDDRFVRMLITEANTHSHLRHRNIVQIFDVGLGDDGQYFLVMEFVPGTDLASLFEALERRGKRLPAHLSVHIAAEVCDALGYAHGALDADGTPLQLVHRDVSPGNVLLSQSGEVKLTDFGIAKRMNEATGHHGVRGKFAYISPEQAINEPVDGRSDIYSLGIVLYELVSGRRLFSAMNDMDALNAVRAGKIPRPRERDPAMPARLEDIIIRATAQDPERRYQSAADFGSALRDYRYSSLTTAGDPALELARIIAAASHERDEPRDEFAPEPTMLRILTAAGFTGIGMDRRLISDHGFDEEATRAMTGAQIQKIIEDATSGPVTGRRGAEAGPPRFNVDETRDVSIDQLLEVAPLAEAETQMFDTRGRLPSVATPTSERPRPVIPERAATPTVREVFHSGAMVDRLPPTGEQQFETEYVARYEEEYFGIPKRKVVALATVLAVLLAVAAFVIAGSLLSSDGDGAAGAAAEDAAGADARPEPRVLLPEDEIQTGAQLVPDGGVEQAVEQPPPPKPKPKAKPKPKPKPKPKAKPKAKKKKPTKKKPTKKKPTKKKAKS